MVVLYHLARLDLPARRAERAVLLTAIFPFAFFFGVVYTESVFLLFTRRELLRLSHAAMAAGRAGRRVATATRVNGILMLPALAWIAWRTVRAESPRSRRWPSLGLALVPRRASALYSLFVYSLTRQPVRVGGVDPAVGLLSRRIAAGWRRFAWCARCSRTRTRSWPASAWRATTP